MNHSDADEAKPKFQLLIWALVLLTGYLFVGGWSVIESFISDGPSADRQNYFVEQYEAAKRSSDEVEMCIYAGMAADLFLDTRDLENHQLWKAIESRDCYNARPLK